MNILRLLFEIFVIYIVYKLIFDFIIPIYRTSKQIKSRVDEMNQKMNSQHHNVNNPAFQQRPQEQTTHRPVSKDYIDYEEIKS